MDESFYYHALASHYTGSRERIIQARRNATSWKAAYRRLERTTLFPLPAPPETWDSMLRSDIALALADAPEYPPLLRETPAPPFGLYYRGSLHSANGASATIGIVGTRRASPEGRTIAERFGRKLAAAGCTVVSGLAFGIDAAAHAGCIAGKGAAIAVLAGGLHDIYPREHGTLAEKILSEGGAIVSEYPPGAPPYKDRFLERNRVIAGLSRGVVIVEAPQGSGSLVTARHAAEANRDVFVVPGSTLRESFKGSHALIRQGATLVTTPEEILQTYGIAQREATAHAAAAASDEEVLILRVLRAHATPRDIDKISIEARLEPRIVNRAISFLLIRGAIREMEGGYTI